MFRNVGIIITCLCALSGTAFADLGGTVFKEDFSKYEVGDPISDWGTTDVVVLKTSDDKTWIQAQTPGIHKAEKRMKLPDSFVLTFEFIYARKSLSLLFIDSSEEIQILKFEQEYGTKIYFSFNDTISKVIKLDQKTVQHIKIVKKNKTFKLFVNDNFVISSTPQTFGKVSGIAFKIEPTTKIGNIEIKELILD